MRLLDQLGEDALVVSLGTGEPKDVIRILLERSFPNAGQGQVERLSRDLAEGRRGERTDAGRAVIWAVQTDLVDTVTVALGVSDQSFELENAPGGPDRRIVVLVLTARRVSALREQVIPTLTRFLKAGENARRVMTAVSPGDLRSFGALMELELNEHLLVEDAMQAVQYRVYAETPFGEVADLMVRRNLQALPVVGPEYEFLGIITTKDALTHLIPRVRKGQEAPGRGLEYDQVLARDVMSRSVLCVSEDQSLVDAANTMVNRDVEQLPVVREGELVGSIDRASVLELLLDQTRSAHDTMPHSKTKQTPV